MSYTAKDIGAENYPGQIPMGTYEMVLEKQFVDEVHLAMHAPEACGQAFSHHGRQMFRGKDGAVYEQKL